MQMSIGQVLGIQTAGDRRRAAERDGLRRGMKRGAEQERSKNEAVNAKRVEFLRAHNIPEELIAEMEKIK